MAPGGVVIYQTTFDTLTSGEATVVGQDGWVGSPSPGPHGTVSAFAGQGQAMYVGSHPFAGATASFKRPVNYAPLDEDTPLVRFSTEIMVEDSNNGFRDDFGFRIHNANGDVLASLIFDNELNEVLIDNGNGTPVGTGISFARGTAFFFDVEMDFADNTWSVWMDGVELFSYETFNGTSQTLDLGDVSVFWTPHDTENPGDNRLLIDNYSLIAYNYTSMAGNGNGIVIQDNGPADSYPFTNTITGLTGRLNRLTVRIEGLNHTCSDNIDVLLVAPDGRSVMLLSDVGGNSNLTTRSLVFDDLAPTSLMASAVPVAHARYRPTNYEADGAFPSPAPNGTPLNSLSGLFGMNPNGTWQLYVVDDTSGNTGSIAAWSLEFGTDGSDTETFSIWQGAYFSVTEISEGTADLDHDADSDGLLNLLEYAFGMNPNGSDTNHPHAPTAFPVTVEGVPYVCYQYVKDTSKSEITYALEVSPDMSEWSPFTGTDVVVSQVGYVETHHAYFPEDTTSNMIRLRVTMP